MLITDQKKIDNFYKALIERKESYVGIFFVAVKTTSIFCIATCRARKPKLENVSFYTSFKEALDNGYRPCKICKPTEHAHEAPAPIARAIQMVTALPKQKITDEQLRSEGISPETLRRWFNQNYGMTFQAYQRMYRINVAYQELKGGKKTTDTAFDNGYESLSGFGYTYKKVVGKSPHKSIGQGLILINRLTTPLGPMFICATEDGVCLLEFVDRKMLETEFKDLQKLLKANIIAGENKHSKQAKKEIAEYFAGKRSTFEVAMIAPGTKFQRTVWEKLKTVPYGQTSNYAQMAQNIGRPKAVRAAATANGCNRIAIMIPCHRIIGKDGQLRGYAGGLERKQWLLDHEAKHATLAKV